MLGGVRSYGFFCAKKFLEKNVGKGVACVASVVFIKKFPLHLATLGYTWLHRESDARDFSSVKNKNPQKNL